MSKEIKDFFEGIELQDGEEFSHESMEELSNNKGDDD